MIGWSLVARVWTSPWLAVRRGGRYVWIRPYKALPVNLPELTGWSSGQFFHRIASLGFLGPSSLPFSFFSIRLVRTIFFLLFLFPRLESLGFLGPSSLPSSSLFALCAHFFSIVLFS